MRYSITGARKMVETLGIWVDQTQDTIDSEESRDYPSDTRLEALAIRLDALETAKDALEELE